MWRWLARVPPHVRRSHQPPSPSNQRHGCLSVRVIGEYGGAGAFRRAQRSPARGCHEVLILEMERLGDEPLSTGTLSRDRLQPPALTGPPAFPVACSRRGQVQRRVQCRRTRRASLGRAVQPPQQLGGEPRSSAGDHHGGQILRRPSSAVKSGRGRASPRHLQPDCGRFVPEIPRRRGSPTLLARDTGSGHDALLSGSHGAPPHRAPSRA